jgi:hypothetical protein
MTKLQPKEPLPDFKNRQEMAEFWDTHDFADYWAEFKPVKVQVSKNLTSSLNIRLDPKSLDELRKKAQKKGVGPTTLARMWILEHLRARSPASADIGAEQE